MVQAAFSPSKAEVEGAMRLVAAYKEHQDKGQGAFVFEGEGQALPLRNDTAVYT